MLYLELHQNYIGINVEVSREKDWGKFPLSSFSNDLSKEVSL